MPRRTAYGPGTPCWVDHITVDLTGAKQFYGGLFGWEFTRENDRGYHLITLRGEIIGGLGPSPMGMTPGSSWNVYLASKDLDHTRTEVGRLGGRVVMGPVPAGEDGRLCLAVDPSGAAVGFWEGGRDEGVVLVDEPGALCACELHTARPDSAEEFYRGLYGDVPAVIRSSSRTGWVPFFGIGDAENTESSGGSGSDEGSAAEVSTGNAGDGETGQGTGNSGSTTTETASGNAEGSGGTGITGITVAAALAAGARRLDSGLFADPLGGVFGLTGGNY
ncbi:VOC family protein [Streptosporangium sp. NPDC000509]|uniref:VOC family protein n=1 Tax=Streptosporangium sp. NPDC000509 TaxID=3366186 RepID=UPI0036C89894